jgi:hypothetical protein
MSKGKIYTMNLDLKFFGLMWTWSGFKGCCITFISNGKEGRKNKRNIIVFLEIKIFHAFHYEANCVFVVVFNVYVVW